jgi:hypothetical protein
MRNAQWIQSPDDTLGRGPVSEQGKVTKYRKYRPALALASEVVVLFAQCVP